MRRFRPLAGRISALFFQLAGWSQCRLVHHLFCSPHPVSFNKATHKLWGCQMPSKHQDKVPVRCLLLQSRWHLKRGSHSWVGNTVDLELQQHSPGTSSRVSSAFYLIPFHIFSCKVNSLNLSLVLHFYAWNKRGCFGSFCPQEIGWPTFPQPGHLLNRNKNTPVEY